MSPFPWSETNPVIYPEIPIGWEYYGDHPPDSKTFCGWSHTHDTWIKNSTFMTEPCFYIIPESED